ncbi:MAG TPA: GntR family transcriptional regulator [Steroidobacteraceae bacterium]|nr:GntR family transcriptional regulator [Steroidobacteraceae bacterium]
MNPSERIYLASTSDGELAGRLAAEKLARLMEDDLAAMGLTPGSALGSLRELSERYRQGRSVVREAVSLLERRGLGRMRPGPCGGFIVAKPAPAAIGAELASHLRTAGSTAQALEDAREALELMCHWQTDATSPVVRLLSTCLDCLAVDGGEGAESAAADGSAAVRVPGSLPAAIARRLAAEIARTGRAGARLGSEWDLCERFQVSRLTLRQAIRLLQDSGLVECRRGRGNGLVIRDRRGPANIRLALAYLIGERLDPLSAGTSLFQLNAFVPALAVSRASAEQRQSLEGALARLEGSESFERYDLLALVHCVSQLADSPIIDLFSRCLAAYEARFHPLLAERLPANAQSSYFRLFRQLLGRMPVGSATGLAQAKEESAALMLDMSRRRPL